MRITFRCGDNDLDGFPLSTSTVSMDNVQLLEIDGQPYVPAPKELATHKPEPPRRWECEVVLCHLYGDYGNGKGVGNPVPHDNCPQEQARCKLAFWSTGEVAFADQRAKWLADKLRNHAECYTQDRIIVGVLREAASRLAGPD